MKFSREIFDFFSVLILEFEKKCGWKALRVFWVRKENWAVGIKLLVRLGEEK